MKEILCILVTVTLIIIGAAIIGIDLKLLQVYLGFVLLFLSPFLILVWFVLYISKKRSITIFFRRGFLISFLGAICLLAEPFVSEFSRSNISLNDKITIINNMIQNPKIIDEHNQYQPGVIKLDRLEKKEKILTPEQIEEEKKYEQGLKSPELILNQDGTTTFLNYEYTQYPYFILELPEDLMNIKIDSNSLEKIENNIRALNIQTLYPSSHEFIKEDILRIYNDLIYLNENHANEYVYFLFQFFLYATNDFVLDEKEYSFLRREIQKNKTFSLRKLVENLNDVFGKRQ